MKGNGYTWFKEPVNGQALPSFPQQLLDILEPASGNRTLPRHGPPPTASLSLPSHSWHTTHRNPPSQDTDFHGVHDDSKRRYDSADGNNDEFEDFVFTYFSLLSYSPTVCYGSRVTVIHVNQLICKPNTTYQIKHSITYQLAWIYEIGFT